MNVEATDVLDTRHVGFLRDTEEFRTNTRRLAQFAMAVDDSNPHHRAGAVAPPVFAHVPIMQSMVEVMNKAASDFILHGEHDFVFHRPIVPGQRLFSKSTLIGMRNPAPGVTFIVKSETATQTGDMVCTQYSTCLIRGTRIANPAGENVPPRPDTGKGEAETVTYNLAADQTRRYADAARDYSPYTIDPEAARRHGFPAPLVHGMCTLAFACRPIVDRHCKGETAQLRRFGCRFAHPLYLIQGQSLTVSHWRNGDVIGFEVKDRDGNAVVRNGYAEVQS